MDLALATYTAMLDKKLEAAVLAAWEKTSGQAPSEKPASHYHSAEEGP